jgi:peroxiredoxin Q/BCP
MVHSLLGKPAPTFSAPSTSGETYNFAPGSTGTPTVLFFFPKAGSYGCTRQVCQLQALTEKETFKRANVQIVGVSADSAEKQKEFVEKQKLTYPILSDESGDARKAYIIGKHFFGPSTRTTFVMDKNGTVRAVLDATMNFAAHAKFVNKELDKLEAEEKKDEAPTAANEQPVEPASEATDPVAVAA